MALQHRQIETIESVPPAPPFFDKRPRWCPQGVSGTRPLSDDDDSLAWYVA